MDKKDKMEDKIDLNNNEVIEESKMVEKGSLINHKGEENLKSIPSKITSNKKTKKVPKKGKTIKVMVGDKSYEVPEKQVFDLSKREYKIREDGKKISQGEVCILYLRESGIGEFKYVRPDNGMFIIQGRYYHINHSCIYNVGKKRVPLAIIPEWSFIPLSKKEYEIVLGSQYQEAQMLIIKSLENAEVVKIQQETQPSKKADGKLIIWIIIIAVIGLYMLQKFVA